MDPEYLVGGLIEGALGGRRGRRHAMRRLTGGTGSLLNASNLLAAAGLVWGLYEAAQAQTAAPATSAPPPLPSTSGTGAAPPLPDELRRIVRLTISAARADGDLSLEERGRILGKARELGVEELVTEELRSPHPLPEIVAGVSDPRLRSELYTLAYGIVRSDDGVTGAERIYLAQLAHQLGLDPAATKALESAADARGDGDQAP
ncbi:MAG TPA: DUF533 domain-containing protein [Vicinamibacteria bacterium]|nr:DUF533 domain-containing protein [Vicinamibacteria bacterium]